MSELCGDGGRPGGALLAQIPLPPALAGKPYREVFKHVLECYSVSASLARACSLAPIASAGWARRSIPSHTENPLSTWSGPPPLVCRPFRWASCAPSLRTPPGGSTM